MGVRGRVRRLLAHRPVEPVVVGARRLGYERRRIARNLRYGHAHRGEPNSIVSALERDGFVVLRNHTPRSEVDRLLAEMELCLSRPDALGPVADDATRAAAGPDVDVAALRDADLAAGPGAYRNRTNVVAVREPFLHCPTALDLAFDPEILAIATSYYRCPAAITGVDLRRSFVNDLPGFGDYYSFHSDPNGVRELKSFTYLNDVDESGGPFLFVPGSHRKRPPGWTAQYLWTRDQVSELFGEDRVVAVTGQAGDVILADTSGFHTGAKPRARDRSIFVVNRFVHKELKGRHPWLRVPEGWIEQLDPDQRRATDYLRVGE